MRTWIGLLMVCALGVVGCLPKENIFEAVKNGNLSRVRKLVQSEPNLLKLKDRDGMSALTLAADKDKLEIVSYLVSVGADVNSTNNAGRTPLHFAAYNGNLAIVQLLVSKGADVNFANSQGSTPLDAAHKADRKEVAEFLATKGATGKPEAEIRAEVEQEAKIKAEIEAERKR